MATQVPNAAATALEGIPALQDFTVAQIEIWILVLIRVSVMVFLLPLLTTEEVPTRFKAGLSFFLSIVLFPLLPATAISMPGNIFEYVLMGLKEVYIGAVMGFASTFIFAGLRFAGSWIDSETGFNMTQIMNPVVGEEDTALTHLIFILFILMLLSTGAYAFYLQALAESFRIIPLTGAHMASNDLLAVFARLTTESFLLGMKVAAPVVATLFISSIALAIIARIMPQMNVWMVGMPMKLALGMMTLVFALPLMWQAFLKQQNALHVYWIGIMRLMGSA
jgi:flagellar biosynthetic protein FliR